MRKVLYAGTAGLMATGVAFAPGAALPAAAANPDGRQAAVVYHWGKPFAGDEFKYKGRPSKAKWSVYNGPGHHNKGRRVPSAWTVANGFARVGGDSKGNTGGMSARWPGADRKYGKWEVRMRVSTRESRYHALALLWPRDGYKRGKCDGEVDFTENTKNLRLTHFYLHYSCANKQSTKAIVNDVTKWHNYAVSWSPTAIVGYIDGKPWFKDTNRSHLPPRPMHVALQLDYFPRDGKGPLKPSAIYYAWVRQYR